MYRFAFVGPIGSGKSTLADTFCAHDKFRKLSFATELKKEFAEAVAINNQDVIRIYEEINDPDKKARWRTGLQWWGTELRRNIYGENYWVDKLESMLHKYDNVVVDDCRFPNEYEMLSRNGFQFFRLEALHAVPSAHESEQHWPNFPVRTEIPWVSPKDRFEMVWNVVLRDGEAVAA